MNQIDKTVFIRDCAAIRRQNPLIHNISNYVAMNLNANALLAIGASPLMSFYEEEIPELVTLSSALVINIGCLDDAQIRAMLCAAKCAKELGRPWVLDPVGVGASKARNNIALKLVSEFKPTVIRANASEVLSLAGIAIQSRGVDSSCSSDAAVDAAKSIANQYDTVVSISGETDYVTDGEIVISIANGSPLMPKVSAMGCTASAITGAFVAVNPSALEAASNAMALMGMAGELAAKKSAGTGSLVVNFLDILSSFNSESIIENLNFKTNFAK